MVKVIELFAGVGGFRVGLEKVKNKNKQLFDIAWSNQWEPSTKTQHASDIYVKNFGNKNHLNISISDVVVEDIPEHDLLVGGFPCQDYSVASTLKNSKGIVGKKGVLWWEIYRILIESKNPPSYLFLENVDRLLQSPSKQRGRDFAIILSSLNSIGYAVEWRVINAADYGMPQRRKRIFIFASKKGTSTYEMLSNSDPKEILDTNGSFAQSFEVYNIQKTDVFENNISEDLVSVTESFNKETPKQNMFFDSGFMIDGKYWTSKVKANYQGERKTIKDILIPEEEVPKEFYITDEELKGWVYQKGSKSIEREDKNTGHKYLYKEGSMGFPDDINNPSRTIITGEGGKSPSRFKHVICINGKHRRLTPL